MAYSRILCGAEMIAVPLFSSLEYYCPRCEPKKIPDKRKTERWIKEKLGFKQEDRQDNDFIDFDWGHTAESPPIKPEDLDKDFPPLLFGP